eukprot:TRINITY_DN4096_c0_g1_i1.p1 TRINITY_DN4096_c0_g1~~TRINITY_DN4096_c0_g1_i1.p1  ORF type:complete len:331 (+),score=36.24 TRINITY_DN4096_c0_g1_i1:31-1023(+)
MVDGTISRVPNQSPHKGLFNNVNTYHCFLNVCLQGCLHLEQLRSCIIEAGHKCRAPEPCLFCEVRYLLQAADRTTGTYLKPDLVREAIEADKETDVENEKMSDAVETFEFLIKRLMQNAAESAPGDPLLRVLPPTCSMVSAPLFLKGLSETSLSLTNLLKVSLVDLGSTFHYTPCIFPYHVNWRKYGVDEQEILKDDIRSFGSTLTGHIDITALHGWSSATETGLLTGSLKGFICYYPGMHYTCFFRLPARHRSSRPIWVHFDDTSVREISSKWTHVVEFLAVGKHIPVLLFYEANEEVPPPETDEDGWISVNRDSGPETEAKHKYCCVS